jgi:hypothetical protein
MPPRDALELRDVLVELPAAEAAAMALDPVAWKNACESLEADWVAPLAQMLGKGRISQIIVTTLANNQSCQWRINRAHLWRFWRSAASLASAAR